jgi:hypothetical protein
MRKRTVIVNDKMQRGYRYQLTEQAGRNFDLEFGPQLTPKEMLRLGVFCGKYMTDTRKEFPKCWFENAKLARNRPDPSLNYFGVDASQPLSVSIRAAGFNGTADIILVAECRKKTFDRLGGGR